VVEEDFGGGGDAHGLDAVTIEVEYQGVAGLDELLGAVEEGGDFGVEFNQGVPERFTELFPIRLEAPFNNCCYTNSDPLPSSPYFYLLDIS